MVADLQKGLAQSLLPRETRTITLSARSRTAGGKVKITVVIDQGGQFMRPPRLRIGWIMALVAIAALNFAAYRTCYYTYWTNDAAWANQLDVLFTGAVPMANI